MAHVTENCNDSYRGNVSQDTVYCTLLHMGLRSHRSVRVPMMTTVHRQIRASELDLGCCKRGSLGLISLVFFYITWMAVYAVYVRKCLHQEGRQVSAG